MRQLILQCHLSSRDWPFEMKSRTIRTSQITGSDQGPSCQGRFARSDNIFLIFVNISILCGGVGVLACATPRMAVEGREQLESVLSFHHGSPRDLTQIIRHGRERLYPPNQFMTNFFFFLYLAFPPLVFNLCDVCVHTSAYVG